jgi:hypothetical protein
MANTAKEGVKLQFNFKDSYNGLHNIYVDSYDEDEARKALKAFANLTPEIEAIQTILQAKKLAEIALGAKPVEQKRQSSGDGPKTCKHGEMTFRTGQSAKGPWKGYFCPSPKGTPDQCEPQFIR